MRSRSFGLATIVLLISVAVGCASQPTAELRLVGDPATRVNSALNDVPYGQPVTEGSILLCVTQPATATLTSVALDQPTGDITVDAFAVRLDPYYQGLPFVGDVRQPLPIIGGGFQPGAPQIVSGVCPDDDTIGPAEVESQLRELAFEVSWSAGEYAGARDLSVTYEIDGTSKTALIPFGIWLCAATCPEGLGLDP
jgi:hypothetical protein